jgi:hypothetical protein
MALDTSLESLKNALSAAEALSTAVSLQPGNIDTLNAADGISLKSNSAAEATAASADSEQGSIASAKSFGLGLGTSSFYFDNPSTNPYYQPTNFNSPNLTTLLGANGGIDGVSRASASTTSKADAATEAVAINIGLANLNLESSDATVLRIGTAADPFEAVALASSSSNAEEDCGCENEPISQLEATAIARGIENPLDGSKTILGQTVANVAATAIIAPQTTNSSVRGTANADAIAIQGAELTTTPTENGNGFATIVGTANATTGLRGVVPHNLSEPSMGEPALAFRGQAIGIDAGTASDPGSITGNSYANNVIQGQGFVDLDVPNEALLVNRNIFDQPCIETELTAIGIQNAEITTSGSGADQVIGRAGIETGVAVLHEDTTTIDLAGIRNTNISTSIGDDTVVGQITSLPTADEFDTSTNQAAFNGFKGGIENANVSEDLQTNQANTVRTGIGEDSVFGSARDYVFEGGIGSDSINLDNAWNALLVGGLGDDRLIASGTTQDVIFKGGSGRDVMIGGSGDGGSFDGNDRLDGGADIDVSTGQGGRDTFVYSHGNGAWKGTENQETNEILQDEESWNDLSTEAQDLFLGNTERITDFQSGTESNADILELSASLGTITQAQWAQEGVIMNAIQATNALHDDRIGIVVDNLESIQAMGMTNRHYAVSVSNDDSKGMLLYDADGNFSQGSQVVAHLEGDMNSLHKTNFQFA